MASPQPLDALLQTSLRTTLSPFFRNPSRIDAFLSLLDECKGIIIGSVVHFFLRRIHKDDNLPAVEPQDLNLILPTQTFHSFCRRFHQLMDCPPSSEFTFHNSAPCYLAEVIDEVTFHPAEVPPTCIFRSSTIEATRPIAAFRTTSDFVFLTRHAVFVGYKDLTFTGKSVLSPAAIGLLGISKTSCKCLDHGFKMFRTFNEAEGSNTCFCPDTLRTFADKQSWSVSWGRGDGYDFRSEWKSGVGWALWGACSSNDCITSQELNVSIENVVFVKN